MSDLDTLKSLVLENQAMLNELRIRDAIILHLMDGEACSLKTADVQTHYGLTPVFTQTKTLIKLGLPDESD